ncbi:hypothetical protein F5B19DRAFT_430049 [Rostrohypoxylon terebratum]|nr:hypothetical protein F5B19DRAFT_430049 [Rostrohypoxylon terebratum]
MSPDGSSSTPTRRCGICRRQKQKCTWTRQGDACDRCLENGFDCPPQKGTPGFQIPTRMFSKCDYCRKAHESCHPGNRRWPDKCEFCIARNHPCTEPRTKREFDEFIVRQGDEESISETTNVENEPHHARHRAIAAKIVPSIYKPASKISDSNGYVSRFYTPDLPPTKRIKENNISSRSAAVEEVERLKGIIQHMEEEFQEILKAEKEKYELGIKALKVKHREDVNQQRAKYESRIDDLIKIMKAL